MCNLAHLGCVVQGQHEESVRCVVQGQHGESVGCKARGDGEGSAHSQKRNQRQKQPGYLAFAEAV